MSWRTDGNDHEASSHSSPLFRSTSLSKVWVAGMYQTLTHSRESATRVLNFPLASIHFHQCSASTLRAFEETNQFLWKLRWSWRIPPKYVPTMKSFQVASVLLAAALFGNGQARPTPEHVGINPEPRYASSRVVQERQNFAYELYL